MERNLRFFIQIDFFVLESAGGRPAPLHCLCPAWEILRLRCAQLRMTNGETLAFAPSVPKRATAFYTPSSRPSAHRARVERSLFSCIAIARHGDPSIALRSVFGLMRRCAPHANACAICLQIAFAQSETLVFALTVISTKRTPCARGEISCIAFCPGMEILRLRRLTGGFTQDDGKRNACFCPCEQAKPAHFFRMTGSETLVFALTVISTKRTPCARGEISFFVHYYIPGMEILRLRCAPFLGSCGAVRLTQTRVRFACKSRSPKAKRFARFYPHRHLDQAHTVRAWRDLFFSCITISPAWRSFGCAALCFWEKRCKKFLCSPHPSLRDTFPPRGRNGMKDYCACPTL